MPGVRRSSPSLGVLLAAVLAGCSAPPTRPEHVIVVLVDALRADHLGCYGYARRTSPNLDALAADATRFANAATSGPWTLPALGTMITSLYPSVHGALRPSDTMKWALDRAHFTPADALSPSFTTLAEVLQGVGFRTIAFVTGAYPGSVFGFAQGPLLTFHWNTLLPSDRPVTEVVGLLALAKVPVPLITVHVPVAGAMMLLPASVTDGVVLQMLWS